MYPRGSSAVLIKFTSLPSLSVYTPCHLAQEGHINIVVWAWPAAASLIEKETLGLILCRLSQSHSDTVKIMLACCAATFLAIRDLCGQHVKDSQVGVAATGLLQPSRIVHRIKGSLFLFFKLTSTMHRQGCSQWESAF